MAGQPKSSIRPSATMPAVASGNAAPQQPPISHMMANRNGETPSSRAREIAGKATMAMEGAGPAPQAETTQVSA